MAGIRGWGTGCLLWLGAATACAGDWQHFGAVDAVSRRADGVELSAGSARVRVTASANGVLRVRMAPDGVFDTLPSWAVLPRGPALARVVERSDEVIVAADGIRALVRKHPFALHIQDAEGHALFDQDSTAVAGTRAKS